METRRSDHQFAIDTFEMNNKLGGYLLDKFPDKLKVDVHHPDLTFELRSVLMGFSFQVETIRVLVVCQLVPLVKE